MSVAVGILIGVAIGLVLSVFFAGLGWCIGAVVDWLLPYPEDQP